MFIYDDVWANLSRFFRHVRRCLPALKILRKRKQPDMRKLNLSAEKLISFLFLYENEVDNLF